MHFPVGPSMEGHPVYANGVGKYFFSFVYGGSPVKQLLKGTINKSTFGMYENQFSLLVFRSPLNIFFIEFCT